MSKWIPLKSEKKPKDGQEVLITYLNEAGIWVGEALYRNGKFYFVSDSYPYEEKCTNPTAWMRMPEPYEYKKHVAQKPYPKFGKKQDS